MIKVSLSNHVFPHTGALPIEGVEPRAVRAVVEASEAAGVAETAGRVFQKVPAIYRFAIAHDLTTTDPIYPLKPAEIFKPRQTLHRAAGPKSEMPAFLKALIACEGDQRTQIALELLILTAVRLGEIGGNRGDKIDNKRAL